MRTAESVHAHLNLLIIRVMVFIVQKNTSPACWGR